MSVIMKPHRSKKYLAWVRSLPSVISGQPAGDAHHLIGHGESGMGTKVTDIWTFPLTRGEHTELHNIGWRAWEEKYGDQWKFVSKTLSMGIIEEVLKI